MAFKGIVFSFARDASSIVISLAAGAVCREVATTFEEGTNVGALAANSEVRVVIK